MRPDGASRSASLLTSLVCLAMMAIALAACGGTDPANPDGQQVVTTPPAAEELVFTPGAYGPLEAGMNAEESLDTGLVERRSEPGCVGTIWLKPAHDDIYLDFFDDGDELSVLGSFEPGPVTDRGVGVGSSVVDLEKAYGADLGPAELNDYEQYVFTVQDGDGYVMFFLRSDQGRTASGNNEVTALLVSRGEPVTIYEGEGPC